MPAESAYARAGVDIDAGNRAVALMKQAVRSTFTPAVLSDVGSFGGLFDASTLQDMAGPVLVASTDGVGTKTHVAARLNRWDTVGQDLVNHCVNDILVQGARPLFFLDYVATSKVIAEQVAAIVGGMALACQAAGCALLGGETAEMPGVYTPGEVDLAGTIVGVVDRDSLLTGSDIRVGDAILALPSTGLHTNGYSLARAALNSLDWTQPLDALSGGTIGDALLAVHRSYLEPVGRLRASGVAIHGLAHITGGGVIENLPRILPPGVSARITRGVWPEPPIFGLIQKHSDSTCQEMFRVFNMGLGMIAVVPAGERERALGALPGECVAVGEMVQGDGSVNIEGLHV
jgi:phosphoribosylformylglycinamidine cyclo-ligase